MVVYWPIIMSIIDCTVFAFLSSPFMKRRAVDPSSQALKCFYRIALTHCFSMSFSPLFNSPFLSLFYFFLFLFISHPHSCTLTRIYAHKSTLFHTDFLPSHRTRYVNTCQVFKDYFGELEEESIRDNFVVVYELLDETMDFGYPQTCESRILRE